MLSFAALEGIGDIESDDDLDQILVQALADKQVRDADVLVVAQKVVSKAEGRSRDLVTVTPSARALELARITGKDARLVELILEESTEVIRTAPNVLIVRHRLGYVMANAGIDHSNIASETGSERVLLLPVDPDASAAQLRERIERQLGVRVGVIVSDSFGRPWRLGTVNIALGVAGLPSLVDRRGETDRYGRTLEATEVAYADAVAAGAALVMGEAAEGIPAVLVRGLEWRAPLGMGRDLIRPLNQDLFQ